eukprot:s238_g6.t1
MPARSVSGRSFINAYGFANRSWVAQNNVLISRKLGRIYSSALCSVDIKLQSCVFVKLYILRMVLLILVMLAKQTTFVVEQPTGSLLFRHNRWEWLVNRVAVASELHYHEACSRIYTVEFAKNMLSAYKEWIPDSWLEAMAEFHEEVRRNVSWVHPI